MWRCDAIRIGNAINKSARNAFIFKPTNEACGLDQPGTGGAIPFSLTSSRVPETRVGYQRQGAVNAMRPDQPM